MASPQTVWIARAEQKRAAEAVLATLEREATESHQAQLCQLQPYDGPNNTFQLRQRELRVYAPGNWHGYDGRTPEEMDAFQYIDWRRDYVGWVDFEIERDEALQLLLSQLGPVA